MSSREQSTAWKGCATQKEELLHKVGSASSIALDKDGGQSCYLSIRTTTGKRQMEKRAGGTGFPACADKSELRINRRNLPHWQLSGNSYFITFRLRSGHLSHEEKTIILDAIKYFHAVRYWVTAVVIMVDHIHLILKPIAQESMSDFPLSKILQGIKGFTAREINKLRNTRGSLWLDESYDRIIRDYDEYLEKWQYIRNNPIKAELCEFPEEYPWLWEPGEYLG